MTKTTVVSITPTQGLILDVLGARHRLGEVIWTFDSSAAITRALRELEAKGLVGILSGVTENTVRAELTEAGRAQVIDPNYRPPRPPPVDPEFAEAAGKILGLRGSDWIRSVRPVKYEVTVISGKYSTTQTHVRTLEIN